MAEEAIGPLVLEAHSEPLPSLDLINASCTPLPTEHSPSEHTSISETTESPPNSPTQSCPNEMSSTLDSTCTEDLTEDAAAASDDNAVDREGSKSDSMPLEDTDPDDDTSQPTSTPKINIMTESSDVDAVFESEPGLDETGDESNDECDDEDADEGQEEGGSLDILDSETACNNLESDDDSPEPDVKDEEEEDAAESEVDKLLKRRMQPIHELVYSEQSYVKRLTIIKEKYMPCLEDGTAEVPEDLANKWRILWGNWLQLDEWHSAFLEKLERLVKDDPDQIPKLFIDYRARLRNIYSKYCENHRKAALIAEQYKEFFDELRVKVADKEDVVSHLMQPVQRIMRYQLPMGEIVKYTERANLPSIGQWRKALDIMKEIPKDTQLILEAARIDGFPGVITSLGNLRIRGQLLMATTTKSELKQPNFNGGEIKFVERKLFLFDQMLLFTEETKPKRKDTFAQSTFQFKHALNVNKMKFESHWAFATDDDEHDMKFVITEESVGKEAVYVLDPGSIAVRERWVIQLRDLQMMQQELLLALTDPKRFAAGGGSGGASLPPTGPTGNSTSGGGLLGALRSGHNTKEKTGHHLSVDRMNSESSAGNKKKKQKWPSFSKKSRSRTEEIHFTRGSKQPHFGSTERLSAPADGSGLLRKESLSNTASDADPNSGALKHRSWSGFSLRLRRSKRDLRKTQGNCQSKEDLGGPGTSAGSTAGTGKKKSLFSNLFGKNKH